MMYDAWNPYLCWRRVLRTPPLLQGGVPQADFSMFAMNSGLSYNQGHQDRSRGFHAACDVQQGSVHAPYMFTKKRVLPQGAVKCADHQDFFTAV